MNWLKILVITTALLCISGKPKEELLDRYECKETGYYIATSDAHMYYVERCVLGKCLGCDTAEKLKWEWMCEGMAELAGALSKEMSWRLDHPEDESICREEWWQR